jgi:hypothetical protein
VALALPPSEYADTRLQFVDEPARVDYCVTGAWAGATLRLAMVNAWGQRVELPPTPLSGSSALTRGAVAVNAFPAALLGQFRIEAWVERDGRRISPFNELLLTRIPRPVHGDRDASGSPFGAHFLPSPLMVKLMKAVGVNWVRLHDAGTEFTGWYHLEKEPGKWTFYDREIRCYRDRHLKILAGLQTAPRWASYYRISGKKGLDHYFDRYYPPADLAAWENYVKTVVGRYRGDIDDYFFIEPKK